MTIGRAVAKILFDGCVLSIPQMKIYVPQFGWLNPQRFNVHFGGIQFILSEKIVTRNAWKAFVFYQRTIQPHHTEKPHVRN